jgi:acetolactate synthase-1/2/3 large subunit
VLALSSGPAFTNALAGLAEASSLSVPIIVVTTRIPTAEIGRGGFQESDQRSMSSSLAKWHYTLEQSDLMVWAVRRLVHLAVNGRPGITILEVADEVSRTEPPRKLSPSGPVARIRSRADASTLKAAARALRSAARPLVVAGGGARGAGPEILALVERAGAAAMTTAAGRGTIPEDHPQAAGLVGLYATPPLDRLQAEADVVVAIGSRLEETARMGWPELQRVSLIQVDADVEAMGQHREPDIALLGDAALTAADLADALSDLTPASAWLQRIIDLKAQVQTYCRDGSQRPSPTRDTLVALREVFGADTLFVHENGLHDIWSYHYPLLQVGAQGRVIVPGEQTLLGFGLPAAIGAAAALRRPAVLLCGDAALGMNASVLTTAAELALGIVIVVFDNQGFGWPRHMRRETGESQDITRFRIPLPVDELVLALGGRVDHITAKTDPRRVLARACSIAKQGGIALVRVPVPDDDVPPGIERILRIADGEAE